MSVQISREGGKTASEEAVSLDDEDQDPFNGLAFVPSRFGQDDVDFVFSTNSSYHMVTREGVLLNPRDCRPKVLRLPNGKETISTVKGELELGVPFEGKLKSMYLEEVYLVPELAPGSNFHVFSIYAYLVHNESASFTLTCDALRIFHGSKEAFSLPITIERPPVFRSINYDIPVAEPLAVWHQRLGHIPMKRLRALVNKGSVAGLELMEDGPRTCDQCEKMMRALNELRDSSGGRKFRHKVVANELVLATVYGPTMNPSPGGKEYFLVCVDYGTRMTHVFLMASRREIAENLKKYCDLAKEQHGSVVKRLCIEGLREDQDHSILVYAEEHGIDIDVAGGWTDGDITIAERMKQRLWLMQETLLSTARMPSSYWASCMLVCEYLVNFWPSKALKDKTPYEAWYGYKPDISHLRVFGTEAVPLADHLHKDKEYRLAGYKKGAGYRLLCSGSAIVTVSRVKFHEKV